MSRTVHHRKPGTPVSPRKRHLPEGRATRALRNALDLGEYDALATSESTRMRRTR